MKVNTLSKVLLLVLVSILSYSQQSKKIKYRRSSLHTILLETGDFPSEEVVLKSYYDAPFPDKYNNHNIGEKSFDPKNYILTEEETKDLDADNSKEAEGKDDPRIISKYFKEKKIANKLVAKWYNRQDDGSFDMSLIGDRGMYDATQIESSIAKKSARGVNLLRDAGEELISNTFIVVSKLKFIDNEAPAKVILKIALIATSKLSGIAKDIAEAIAYKAYEKAREGYSVWTSVYLYRLKWDKDIATKFYTDLWIDKSSLDSIKKAEFDVSDMFEMEFIGKEKATSLVTGSFKEQRNGDELIKIATIRNIDRAYVKLQKKYESFKVKSPLYSGYPIIARIGMKEGLKGGEKFEVLELLLDEKTGKTIYKSVGKIKVNKKQIWDNRYTSDSIPSTEMKGTVFKGSKKKFYAGMLIRQLK